MPGRFKSCRRSASELFSKEEEQPPELPEMTPLRWRSTSMKQLQNAQGQNSSEQSIPSHAENGQTSGEEVPARSAEESTYAEAKHVTRSLPDAVLSPEKIAPGQTDNASPKDREIPSTEALPGEPPNGEHVRNASIGEIDGRGSIEGSPIIKPAPVEEIVEFQPVDLDQKYRRKELIRHVTAAKIQNREESLLNNPSLPILEARKAPPGDEPAAMTIEFLRARLLAERSASKATKQQMSHLTKKVADLEARLAAEVELRQAEVELRKKAEVALQEALAKLNQMVVPSEQAKETLPVSAAGSQANENGDPKAGGETAAETNPGQIEVSPNNKTVLRPESEDMLPAQASDKGTSESQNGSKSSETSDSASSTERESSSPIQTKTRKDTRTAIEERLRTMWRQIGQEMAALGDEDSVRQELMGWMGQVPKVLQAKQSESSKSVAGAKLGVILPDSSLNGVKNPTEAVLEDGSKTESAAEKSETAKNNAFVAKQVSKLVEQYEAQETAQREWEENFEAHQTNDKDEDGLPPLVTADGNVIAENGSNRASLQTKSEAIAAVNAEDTLPAPLSKSKSFDLSSQSETQLSKSKSFDSSIKPAFARSRTKSFDLSHDATSANASRRASFNGRIEIIEDQPTDNGVSDELIDDEDAEELPNGIYLHHSRDEDDSYRRASKDLYGRTPERLPPSRGFHSPSSRSDRGHSNGYNSPGSRSDRGPHRERFLSHGAPVDSMGDVDSQGWPVREVKDRASRDVYYAPVMNNRTPRGDAGPYAHSEREYLQKPRTERGSDESLYRSGPGPRWDPHMGDPSWVQRQEERRMSDPHYSHSSSEDGAGAPYPSTERDMRGPYTYPDRDHMDYDLQYRNTYRQRGELGPRGDAYRGMPPPWQEAENPGMVRSRTMGQRPYGYAPPYSVEEPQLAQNIEAGGYSSYHGRSEMHYPPHAAPNRPDYYPQYGMPGPRSSMNGYPSQPDNPSSINRGYGGWDSGSPQQERSAAVVPADDGEAGEVLKALRIAKQQIKSTSGEQQGYMTAQYTVSSEHRYGVGGQVSKTSYTVEAPVGYPRVTKTFHEGWHLEGKSKRLGMDVNGAHVSDLISTAGPLAVTNGESSYVEKLNVGRGIQFFFS
ncbi:hypothetical protein MPTK1_6g12490 [Marchantia polymorpha subsp. ruderalis]|uniref:Uncharacterized protein n=2 Tax=Marchantia polymorpha TaxID=3197 RepID=A0AAF6BRB3_MARPO|nr:hypothetical protein MARPO_0059s0098 [Marchantia polymorpha]BBN14547.1 hypothetical protein Mp_6g12490 [Marchantia polymorpha subsp. ruderalis]|eukprot:PTQ37173.1 hypothetical protein MARPO_0059s0098 [Marchantia polymorpha]